MAYEMSRIATLTDQVLWASTKTIFDENPEVVVRVLRNDAFARNRFDIRFADRRIFGMQSSVQLQLILGERKQMREDAIFRVSLRSLLPPCFDRLAILV